MLISLCIPCGNRLHDLRQTLPYTITAANASPPVEIAILDYASTDGIGQWFAETYPTIQIAPGNSLCYRHYSGRDHFHKAHAFNLSIMSSSGDYFVLMGADAFPAERYIQVLRMMIADGHAWMRADTLRGIICCKRQAFIDAGGYHEAFEFYGPEDRDLEARLIRRGLQPGIVPNGLMDVIRTSNADKAKNYRLPLSKREMSDRMRPIYERNCRDGVMVANQGREWGQWE